MVYTVNADATLSAGEVPELLWVFRRSRRQWLDEWRRGERSGEFFYGMIALRERYRVGFIEDASRNPYLRAWYPVERLVASRVGMGFALDVALRHWRALQRARVVVSTVDACGLPLAMLKRVGLLRSPLVYISQGLSDRIDAYGRDRRLARWYRHLLGAPDDLATLSEGARRGLAAWLAVPAARIHVLPFGTDHAFWHPTGSAPAGVEARIVSVGSDAGRDYGTLLAAAAGLPLHIVTRQPLPATNGTVRHTSEHSPAELRDLYSGARFIVIPLHDRDQPSGQSAALQAMACAKAVVLTRTRGWWGEDLLHDGVNCVLVPPGDVEALRRALSRLAEDPPACARLGAAARATVERHFGEARFAGALARVVDTRLGRAATPAGGPAC